MSELVAKLGWDADGREGLREAHLIPRYLCFFAGLLINSFGIAFITKAALGTSPVSSIPYVLALEFAPSFGVFTFVLNSVYIIVQVALLRRDFQPVQLLQILANLAFSAFIDVSMGLLWWLEPQGLLAEAGSLALGCCILAFGLAVEVAPNVIVVPGEGVVRAVASKVGRPFGTCKLCFDTTLVVVACCLSFAFFGGLNGLGVGTIVSALVVGPICNLINARVPLVEKIRGLVPAA
ncbi:YczE/YyaS/YitT family protein [Thermophilibacter sp.]